MNEKFPKLIWKWILRIMTQLLYFANKKISLLQSFGRCVQTKTYHAKQHHIIYGSRVHVLSHCDSLLENFALWVHFAPLRLIQNVILFECLDFLILELQFAHNESHDVFHDIGDFHFHQSLVQEMTWIDSFVFSQEILDTLKVQTITEMHDFQVKDEV